MHQATFSDAPLATSWAFVVQLRQGTPLTPQELLGRVEHITSGQASDFHSPASVIGLHDERASPAD